MGGVSITESGSGLDVQTVLNGGPEFLKRLEQWQAAKDAHDQAFEKLGVGHNIIALRDEAARLVGSAREEAEAIKQQSLDQATAKQRSLNDFVAKATQETTAALERAQAKEAEADRKLAMADEHLAAASKKNAEADERLTAATNAHEAVKAAAAALNKAL